MIRIATAIFFVSLALPTLEQNNNSTNSTPISPCPNVFDYEPPGTEPGRWYGVVHLSTDSTLHSLWLNIVLDSKADILGNWVGDVTTKDNIDFKIENAQMKINPGPAVTVRFFVQYNILNKTPTLKAIRLNGKEICNADTPQPNPFDTVNVATQTQINKQKQPVSRPSTQQTPSRPSQIRPQDIPETRPINPVRPNPESPVYVMPVIPNPSSITHGSPSQTYPGPNQPGRITPRPISVTPSGPSTEIADFPDESNGETESEYFEGGQPFFILPSSSGNINSNRRQFHCGKVAINNPIPLVVNGLPTLEGQWPWQIALYQTQTVDNKYICGGTLVSHRHVITAAHCVTKKNSRRVVNKDTLTVYLGKHNLRTSVNGVQIRFVGNITVHPEYNATTFNCDLSILELREPVQYSNWIQPICLWPEHLIDKSNVVGKKGSVVGWGYDETGMATEELNLAEMPVIDQETCLRSYTDFFGRFTSEYTYCAGYRGDDYNQSTGVRKRTSVCNGDSGGGMVFKMDDYWYLRGLVSVAVARQNTYSCDLTHYVVFTDLAQFLPWIRSHIYDL